MAAKRGKRKVIGRKARGGQQKVKFLAVLPAAAIKGLKLEAIERGVNASEVLEESVAAWVKRNRDAKPRTLETVPANEKRQFLSRMDAEHIRDIKVLAIDWGVTASTLVGEAVTEWLARDPQEQSK